MIDRRKKNAIWYVTDDGQANCTQWEQCQLAVLMDIRDELQDLNRVLKCPNFLAIPSVLRLIARRVKRPTRRRVTR